MVAEIEQVKRMNGGEEMGLKQPHARRSIQKRLASTMNLRTDERPNILMISKDWGSTGVWVRTQSGGMANCTTYDRFNFPEWLVRKFDFWSVWYENNDPLEIEKILDSSLWNAYGLSLAIDVKRIVGDRYVVYYDTEQEIPLIPFDPAWLPPRDDLDKSNY
jgi:hypothetical protein